MARPGEARKRANQIVLVDLAVIAVVVLVVQVFLLQPDGERRLGPHHLALQASGRPGSILATLTVVAGSSESLALTVEFSTRSGQRVVAAGRLPGQKGQQVRMMGLLADIPGDGEVTAIVRLEQPPLRWRPLAQLIRADEVEFSAPVEAGP